MARFWFIIKGPRPLVTPLNTILVGCGSLKRSLKGLQCPRPAFTECCIFMKWNVHPWSSLVDGEEGSYMPKWFEVCAHEMLLNRGCVWRTMTKFVWHLGRYVPSPSVSCRTPRSFSKRRFILTFKLCFQLKQTCWTSVTRFDEISPLWQRFERHSQY